MCKEVMVLTLKRHQIRKKCCSAGAVGGEGVSQLAKSPRIPNASELKKIGKCVCGRCSCCSIPREASDFARRFDPPSAICFVKTRSILFSCRSPSVPCVPIRWPFVE